MKGTMVSPKHEICETLKLAHTQSSWLNYLAARALAQMYADYTIYSQIKMLNAAYKVWKDILQSCK